MGWGTHLVLVRVVDVQAQFLVAVLLRLQRLWRAYPCKEGGCGGGQEEEWQVGGSSAPLHEYTRVLLCLCACLKDEACTLAFKRQGCAKVGEGMRCTPP